MSKIRLFGKKDSLMLVGMMGAGKTQIGALLAKKLGVPFHDSDIEVENASMLSLRDLYDVYGEAVYRETEARILKRLLSDPTAKVISAGGGAYQYESTRILAQEKAVTVWVQSPVQNLIDRINRTNRRPELDENDPACNIEELLEKRRPVYETTDMTAVNDDSVPLEDVVENILEQLRQMS